MNHIPSYPVLPKTAYAKLNPSIINTSTTITENSTLLYTTPTNSGGTLFSNIILACLGNTAASVVRIFLNNGADYNVATNNVLLTEYAIPAVTASTTVIAHRQQQILEILLPPKFRVFLNLTATSTSEISVIGSFLDY